MDFEKVKPLKKEATPERLLDVCQRFADALAGGKWFKSQNREVSISRSFTEVIGQTTTRNGDEAPLVETRLQTAITFEAEKEVIREFDDGDELLQEVYTVCATVSQVIHYTDLPAHVLEEFIDDVKEDIFEEMDADDGDEDSATYDIESDVDVSPETLAAYKVEREQGITYVINDYGELDDYQFVVRYKANGTIIDESEYGRVSDAPHNSFLPTAVADAKVLEFKSTDKPQLTEADITEFISTFDQVIQNINDHEEFDVLSEDLGTEDQERLKHVLGAIAMVSQGFKLK